jgi:putative endonuclease
MGPDPESRDSGFADAPRNDTVDGSRKKNMSYYVYIIASRKDGAIYIGVTNDIVRRIYEHRIKAVPGFASKYNITRLVWFEIYDDPISAISREKE